MRVQVLVLAAFLLLLVQALPGCTVDQLVGNLAVATDGGTDGGTDDGGTDSEDGGVDPDEDGGTQDGGGDELRATPLRRE